MGLTLLRGSSNKENRRDDNDNDAACKRYSRPWDNLHPYTKPSNPPMTPHSPVENHPSVPDARQSRPDPSRRFSPVFTPVVRADSADHAANQPRRSAHSSISDRMKLFENAHPKLPARPPDIFPDIAVNTFASATVPPSRPPPPPVDEQPPQIPLPTRIGNRDVKPLIAAPKTPPLVGLPIPPPPSAREPRPRTNKSVSIALPQLDPATFHDVSPPPVAASAHVPADVANMPRTSFSKSSTPSATNMDLEDPDLMPRFSYRHSVRMAPKPLQDTSSSSHTDLEAAARSSVGNSRRISNRSRTDLRFLPESSSFLDFNDDDRLAPLDQDSAAPNADGITAVPSIWGALTFDEPDSFDTFGSLPQDLQQVQDIPLDIQAENGVRPESDESEKPVFPAVSSRHHSKTENRLSGQNITEEDDGGLDVPSAFTARPGAEGALRDLQRASVTAGNELASSLRRLSMAHHQKELGRHGRHAQPLRKERVSKVQGELLLRSRIFRRWNIRYASIVHQGYFGAVLLLFRPDSKGVALGHVTLKNSKMIALTESTVRRVDSNRKTNSTFMFELKTSQRTYTFACNDEESRNFWMSSLMSTRT